MNNSLDDSQKPMDEDRRHSKRLNKNFILSYFHKNSPEQIFEITQLRNISMGGMCFITSLAYEPATPLGIKLQTPFLTENTYIEGYVLASHEKAKGLLYETRLKFTFIDVQAKLVLEKMIKFF